MADLNCRKVLITGVSSGLGYGLAKELLARDVAVYGVSRRDPRGSGAGDLSKASHFHFQAMDLRGLESLSFQLAGFLGSDSLDCVILNAGVLSPVADMKETALHQIREVMEINVYANKVILDFLQKRKNRPKYVLAISSGASVSGNRGWNAYSMSKASLNMLVQLYAAEMPDSHLISLAPGLIDTDMQEYLASLPEDERFDKIARLKEMRGTENMPQPVAAAKSILDKWGAIFAQPSGSFVDIRQV